MVVKMMMKSMATAIIKFKKRCGRFVIFHNYCIFIFKTFILFLNLSISLVYHSTRLYLFYFASFNSIQSNLIFSHFALSVIIFSHSNQSHQNFISFVNLLNFTCQSETFLRNFSELFIFSRRLKCGSLMFFH